MSIDIKDIVELISDYRLAEETEDYDSFCYKYGEYDQVVDTLILFIEKELL